MLMPIIVLLLFIIFVFIMVVRRNRGYLIPATILFVLWTALSFTIDFLGKKGHWVNTKPHWFVNYLMVFTYLGIFISLPIAIILIIVLVVRGINRKIRGNKKITKG